MAKQKYAEARALTAKDLLDRYSKNTRQRTYLQLIQNNTLVLAIGPAGTGKTFTAALYAATQLLENPTNKVVITRPYASCGSTMGYNKGTLEEKITPFLLPLLGYFTQFLGAEVMQNMIGNRRIRIEPLETIRGQSFDNTIIIADEMQSADIGSVQALVTRIGKDSKLIVAGDPRQNDLRGKSIDGVTYLAKILDKYNIRDSAVIVFTEDDILRSGIVKDFVLAFNKEGWAS